MPHWHMPLDPSCPKVEHWGMIEVDGEWIDDPIMASSGCGDEFYEDFEKRHRADCTRCQEYGTANIEVAY